MALVDLRNVRELRLKRARTKWTRPGTDLRHEIRLTEVGDGVFTIACSCGGQTYTAWGIEHALTKCRAHLIANGLPIPKEMWPSTEQAREDLERFLRGR